MEISFDNDGTLNWHGLAEDFRYSGKFDGKDYPVTGPDANLKRREMLMKIDDHIYEDIAKDEEKPFQLTVTKLSADGNTMWVTSIDLLASTPSVRNYSYNRSVMQRKAQ